MMSANAPEALTQIADSLALALECILRQAHHGFIALDAGQEGILVAARQRILTELRGTDRQQLLAEITTVFALKLLRLEAPA